MEQGHSSGGVAIDGDTVLISAWDEIALLPDYFSTPLGLITTGLPGLDAVGEMLTELGACSSDFVLGRSDGLGNAQSSALGGGVPASDNAPQTYGGFELGSQMIDFAPEPLRSPKIGVALGLCELSTQRFEVSARGLTRLAVDNRCAVGRAKED